MTPHAANAGRRDAMRRAAAEVIAEHLVVEHGVVRRDTGHPPAHPVRRLLTGLEQPRRSIEPLLRLYLRLTRK